MSFLDNIVNNITSWASDVVDSVSDSYDDWTEPESEPEEEEKPEQPFANGIVSDIVSKVSNALPDYSSGGGKIKSKTSGSGMGTFSSAQQESPFESLASIANDVYQKASNVMSPEYKGSEEHLEDLQRAFQNRRKEDSKKELDDFKNFAENQLYSQYASMGVNPYDDPTFQQNLDSVRNIKEVPGINHYLNNEFKKRFEDGNGNIKANPLEWNILGLTSQSNTPKEAENLYNYLFDSEDYKQREKDLSPYVSKDNKVVDRSLIDDGSSPESREGAYMTGDQYRIYRETLGLPGRPVSEILPGKLYSKQDEADNYGFVPYLVSTPSPTYWFMSDYDKYREESDAHLINKLFNDFANLRRDNVDFEINVNGQKSSGQDFVKQMDLASDKLQKQFSNPDNWKRTEDPNDVTGYSIAYDGVKNNLTGEVKHILPSSVGDYAWGRADGTAYIKFPDGDIWEFKDSDQLNNNVLYNEAADPSMALAWDVLDINAIDPVILSDGTTIDAPTAFDIMEQISEGKGENIDYGKFNMGKQVVELPDLPIVGNFKPEEWQEWINNGEFVPWFTDMTLGSLPFFSLKTGIPRGIGRAAEELGGISPDPDKYSGTYSLISENPTTEQAVSQSLGSLALPLTEHLWGPLGGQALSVIPRLSKDAVKSWNPLKRYLSGALGEGLEEIPGNWMEEMERSGNRDWYKNYAEGDYSDTHDSQGRALREDTGFLERLLNFAKDAPESVIGGLTLGGVLGSTAVPSYIKDYSDYRKENRKYGDNLVKPGEAGRTLTDEEKRYYNYNG